MNIIVHFFTPEEESLGVFLNESILRVKQIEFNEELVLVND